MYYQYQLLVRYLTSINALVYSVGDNDVNFISHKTPKLCLICIYMTILQHVSEGRKNTAYWMWPWCRTSVYSSKHHQVCTKTMQFVSGIIWIKMWKDCVIAAEVCSLFLVIIFCRTDSNSIILAANACYSGFSRLTLDGTAKNKNFELVTYAHIYVWEFCGHNGV